jgi:hypothetical protein
MHFSAARAAEEIVRNFGIAITSTVVGIALRVLFNQMRRDPLEVERTARARAGGGGSTCSTGTG